MKTKFIASLASAALVVSPIAANAQARSSSATADSEGIAGASTGMLIFGLALVAAAIFVIADDSGSSTPASP